MPLPLQLQPQLQLLQFLTGEIASNIPLSNRPLHQLNIVSSTAIWLSLSCPRHFTSIANKDLTKESSQLSDPFQIGLQSLTLDLPSFNSRVYNCAQKSAHITEKRSQAATSNQLYSFHRRPFKYEIF